MIRGVSVNYIAAELAQVAVFDAFPKLAEVK